MAPPLECRKHGRLIFAHRRERLHGFLGLRIAIVIQHRQDDRDSEGWRFTFA
jgi:hypothetical protein